MFRLSDPRVERNSRIEIWTSPDLTFCESGPAAVENTFSELVQISLFWQIWTSPDFLILANLD